MRYSHPDGTIHLSLLKRMDQSPAHYRQACIDAASGARKTTRAMNVGTIAHRLLLGQRDGHEIACFDGPARRGKAWDAFALEHAGKDIVTAPEWAAAEVVAKAVREDLVAGPLLEGARCEVPMRWIDSGIPCGTDGIDVLGKGFVADLKFTNSAEPTKFQRHAINMFWHAQMAFYGDGAKANGHSLDMGVLLIAAECAPPYPVTVHALEPEVIEHGRKSYVRWLERLRWCEENDVWPGYAESVIPFTLPPWLADDGVGYEGEATEDVA